MTAWRHLSMKSLLFGLIGYMISTAFVLFVKFIKDAQHKNDKALEMLAKALNTTATPAFRAFIHQRESESVEDVMNAWKAHVISAPNSGKIHDWILDMNMHGMIAISVLVIFIMFSCYLIHIYRSHLTCFQEHYAFAHKFSEHL